MTGERPVPWSVELLADCPQHIPAVGDLRWREWGRAPEPGQLAWWAEVTRRQAGRDELPVTFVALDHRGAVAGAAGLGEFDPAERRDRSPWVLGMIVRAGQRGLGAGRLLMTSLCSWATEHGYPRLWVATDGQAAGFYRRCGFQHAETFHQAEELVTVLMKPL